MTTMHDLLANWHTAGTLEVLDMPSRMRKILLSSSDRYGVNLGTLDCVYS